MAKSLYDAVAATETGGIKDPWIRTKYIPESGRGSSAYGPLQVTGTYAKGLAQDPKFTKQLSKDEQDYLQRFIAQSNKFLKYGNEDKSKFSKSEQKEFDKFQYGKGGELTSAKDKKLYESVFGKALEKEAARTDGSAKEIAEVWHGRDTGDTSARQTEKLDTYEKRLAKNMKGVTLGSPANPELQMSESEVRVAKGPDAKIESDFMAQRGEFAKKPKRKSTADLDIRGLLAGMESPDEDEMRSVIEQEDSEYVVQPGDTLSKIARRKGLDWKELARINNLDDPNKIMPGQKLALGDEVSEYNPTVRDWDIPGFDPNKSLSEMLDGMGREEAVPAMPEPQYDPYLGGPIKRKNRPRLA